MEFETIARSICQVYFPLSKECLQDAAQNSTILHAEKNTILVREGQYADITYYLYEGCARAYYLKDGKDITDWFSFEGNFICSINSFFQDIPSPHYIEVLSPAILLAMDRESFLRLSDKHRDFDRLGKYVVTQTMLRLQQRIVSVQFETARQKYENLLKINPDITLRVPLMHIASYLGITLETLSRIRGSHKRI